MSASRGSAPTWLYSFVDLAFLMLIAMSQIDFATVETPDFGDILMPRIQDADVAELPDDSRRRWQVRVYPVGESTDAPFALVASDYPDAAPARLDAVALSQRLAALEGASAKPLLAAHAHSHSEDMLAAITLIERHWPSQPTATIAPVSALR